MIRLVTGDECGLVKLVDVTKRLLLSTLGGGDEQTRKREIVQTVWLPSSQAEEDDENFNKNNKGCANVEIKWWMEQDAVTAKTHARLGLYVSLVCHIAGLFSIIFSSC